MKSVILIATLLLSELAAAQTTLPILGPQNQMVCYVDANNGSDNAFGAGHTAAVPRKTIPWKSNCALMLRRGCTWTGSVSLLDLTNISVKEYGALPTDQITDQPTLFENSAGNLLSFSGKSSNIAFDHINFCSAYTNLVKNGITWHYAVASFGNLKGSNLSFANCGLGPISEGFYAADADNVTIDHCQQLDPLGITFRFFMAIHVSNLTFTNNTCTGSINESPFRCTTDGILTGVITNNTFIQPLCIRGGRTAFGNGVVKACMTIRAGNHIRIESNTFFNGELSINYGASNQTITNSTITNNVIWNSQMEIRPGSVNNIFSGNVVHAPLTDTTPISSGEPCISVDADPLSTNAITGNTMYGDVCGLKFYKTTCSVEGANTLQSDKPGTKVVDGVTSSVRSLGNDRLVMVNTFPAHDPVEIYP